MKKAKNTLRVWKRLLGYIIGHHKGLFTIVMICILASACVTVIGSLFLEMLIDDFITPLLQQQSPSFDALLSAICIMGAIYLAGVLASFVYTRLMAKISQSTLKKIRDDMFIHMQKLPIGYFDTHTHGDVMSHYTNDTDTLRQFIGQSIPQLISAIITIIAIFVAMFISNVPLTILVLIISAGMVVATKLVGGASSKYFIEQQESLGKMTGYIEEMVNGQKVIKVFCHEDETKEQFDKNNEELCHDATNANRFANILMPVVMQLGNLQYVLIAFIGGLLALSGIGGSITVGVIIAFLNLSKTFNTPVAQISEQISMIAMALAGAERIFDLIDEKPEQDGGTVTLARVKYNHEDKLEESNDMASNWAWKQSQPDGSFAYTPLKGDILFQNVDFGYTKKKMVLHNINLHASPGQKIAFVGATGAGKTTITNLINRFYDLNNGEILYDGIAIQNIRKPDLRRSLGVVLQDVNLFTGTIMDNIRYGRLDATDEECIAAAKLANAHHFINSLPDGYQTMLTQNASSLSQGQRQLISIARAAVADPPVMVLDEATSSIDTRTEKLVQQGMDNLMLGRTVFVIAHRLSTIRNSDAIMVLDQGRIIERGTHEELIQKHGVYYSLYTGAFELE